MCIILFCFCYNFVQAINSSSSSYGYTMTITTTSQQSKLDGWWCRCVYNIVYAKCQLILFCMPFVHLIHICTVIHIYTYWMYFIIGFPFVFVFLFICVYLYTYVCLMVLLCCIYWNKEIFGYYVHAWWMCICDDEPKFVCCRMQKSR